MKKKDDIYQRVTHKIIADLEQGQRTWMKPWSMEHLAESITIPKRHNGMCYQGLNILLLWDASVTSGFSSNCWMTFRQAKELGGHVKKGMKGHMVIYTDKMVCKNEDDTHDTEEEARTIYFTKNYTVFNTEQIEGLPADYYQLPEVNDPDIKRDDQLESFFSATQATIGHGGNRAYYNKTSDRIQIPHIECFEDAKRYYATLSHELIHWTSYQSRLDRDFGRKRWGDEGYAMEELVAELGAAFLCAELGITPEVLPEHAAYIDSWLRVLKKDKKAIFTAASHAQRAVDFLKTHLPN